MFWGEHQHSLDAKGRVILPARFRHEPEGGAVVATALHRCRATSGTAAAACRIPGIFASGPIQVVAFWIFGQPCSARDIFWSLGDPQRVEQRAVVTRRDPVHEAVPHR